MCGKCQVGLWEEEQICPGCGQANKGGLRHGKCGGRSDLLGLTNIWAYEGMAKKIITVAKYRGQFAALEVLCEFEMQRDDLDRFREFLSTKPILVPIPLYKTRFRERGFNQAEVIAELLAQKWSLPVKKLLTRVRDTGHQAGRERWMRMVSIREAFQVSAKGTVASIVLVDDVWTTGATMNEAARELSKAGFKRIWGLVLAH